MAKSPYRSAIIPINKDAVGVDRSLIVRSGGAPHFPGRWALHSPNKEKYKEWRRRRGFWAVVSSRSTVNPATPRRRHAVSWLDIACGRGRCPSPSPSEGAPFPAFQKPASSPHTPPDPLLEPTTLKVRLFVVRVNLCVPPRSLSTADVTERSAGSSSRIQITQRDDRKKTP